MRKMLGFGFAATLLLALVFSENSEGQPERKGPFGKKGGFPRPVTVDQIVDRIMSFDKNNDGKITSDELSERMQHLVALGDIDKNGALDREEIRKLATTLESFAGLTGAGGPGGGGPPPGAPPKGPKGPKGGPFKGPAGEAQRTLDDLNVTGATREKVDRALRAQQDKMRRFEELTRAELMLTMKDVLNEEDYRVFKSALDRPPGPFGGRGAPPRDVRAGIDRLQKELDELRAKLPK
jgi:hypothetical protein